MCTWLLKYMHVTRNCQGGQCLSKLVSKYSGINIHIQLFISKTIYIVNTVVPSNYYSNSSKEIHLQVM